MIKIFSSKSSSLKILFVSTEAAPYAKVGGLGSVMFSLSRALRRIGHDARIMMPRYLSVSDKDYDLKMVLEGMKVPTDNETGAQHLICNVKSSNLPYSEKKKDLPPAYFLENQEYYEMRANVYGYADDTVRWALLARGTLEFLRVYNHWTPDVIVATDWMTGLLPDYLKTTYKNDPKLSKIASVFSIHNLFHQGTFDHRFVQEMDFDDGHSAIPSFSNPRLAKLNGMRRGIMYADAINTVSPTYAKEIMTSQYGEMLDDLLRERRAVLYGILNGIDYDTWNPGTNPYITHHFSSSGLDQRLKNKAVLQDRFGLPADKDIFVASIVGRLTEQKGLELLHSTTKVLLEELGIQLVVVGEGETNMMHFFNQLEKDYPKQVAVHLKFDPVLPYIVFAGADVEFIPSKFEPSGLTQMEAMRFGAIPIIRKTGGLADTVEDYNPKKNSGTGFVFERYDPLSLLIASVRAFENYRSKENWAALQKRAMEKDFSWEHSAKRYEELFSRALEFHARSK